MDFSVIDTETLKAWHVEALRALQSLSIGRREVSLSYSTPGSGRSGTYSAARQWGRSAGCRSASAMAAPATPP